MRAAVCCLSLLSLIAAVPAMAFVSEPELDPNPAMAGEVVNILIQTGVCDSLLGGENPIVIASDETISVLIRGRREFDPIWCFFPTVDRTLPIGTFPPGEYIVTVNYRFERLIMPPETEHLGDFPLIILGLPPQPVPSIGWVGKSLLIFLLMILGGISCARKAS